MGDSSGHKLEDIIGSHITPRKRATLNHRKRIPTMTRTVAHSQPIEDHTGRPLAAGPLFCIAGQWKIIVKWDFVEAHWRLPHAVPFVE